MARAARDDFADDKAVQLGAAVRAGLPVAAGFALTVDLVETVARGRPASQAKLAAICARLTGPLAVRSSGAGEDSATASFAGQHATVLGVRGLPASPHDIEWAFQTHTLHLLQRRPITTSLSFGGSYIHIPSSQKVNSRSPTGESRQGLAAASRAALRAGRGAKSLMDAAVNIDDPREAA